ncbi:MAG: shikimate kinase [Caedimonas sp.]|jgi:shikimate kinase|nr:shikimate kinase [Caedimonas sp.]
MSTARLIILPKTITLVGMMGVGKTSVGRRLAKELGVLFRDSDQEVENAAGQTVANIYEWYGEQAFKDTERRVITRLLSSERPHILSTGVEAFINPESRAVIKEKSYSVWLRASLETIYPRVAHRSHRPQLEKGDKQEILEQLINQYYPVYSEADIQIECDHQSADLTVDKIIDELETRFWK